MSDADLRAEVFTRLGQLAAVVSEMRAAQLVAAVGELCSDLHGRGLWDATDEEFLEALWQFRRNYEATAAAAATGNAPDDSSVTSKDHAHTA